MSTPTGNALHLAKRLNKAVAALEAVARHPAATPEDRAAVQRAKDAFFPIFIRIRLAILGRQITTTFVRLADWCRAQGITKGASHE